MIQARSEVSVQEQLARIHDPLGVESLFDGAHQGNALRAMFLDNELAFADANPMFPTARPTQGQRTRDNLLVEIPGAFQSIWLGRHQDDRVEVTIADMT